MPIGTDTARRTAAIACACPGGMMSSTQPSPNGSSVRMYSIAASVVLKTQFASRPSHSSSPKARTAERRSSVASCVGAIGSLKRRQPSSMRPATCARSSASSIVGG